MMLLLKLRSNRYLEGSISCRRHQWCSVAVCGGAIVLFHMSSKLTAGGVWSVPRFWDDAKIVQVMMQCLHLYLYSVLSHHLTTSPLFLLQV